MSTTTSVHGRPRKDPRDVPKPYGLHLIPAKRDELRIIVEAKGITFREWAEAHIARDYAALTKADIMNARASIEERTDARAKAQPKPKATRAPRSRR